MRAAIFTLATLAVTAAGGAGAQSRPSPAVVELFTSQGCSSCPPADAVLADIAKRGDVIALALHVDYWDYIGWKDTFGDPAFAARQRSYAQVAGEGMVYTPQMIVNGGEELVGTDSGKLRRLLKAPADAAADLTVTRDGATLAVRATASRPLPDGTLVQLVRYIPTAAVSIERGENSGRTITYTNIVTSWQTIGHWDGRAPLSLDVPAKGDLPAVIIIQKPGPGAVLAAAAVK